MPSLTRTFSYTPKPYWYSIFESGITASSTGKIFPFFEKYLNSMLFTVRLSNCGQERTRTSNSFRNVVLSHARLPISPPAPRVHYIQLRRLRHASRLQYDHERSSTLQAL